MAPRLISVFAWASTVSAAALVTRQPNAGRGACPGYTASNVANTATGLTADLALAGPACNVYGTDIEDLRLSVNYDNGQLPSTIEMLKQC